MIELFNKLMEAREVSNILHLSKSDTQSKHEALEDFYNELHEQIDQFVEVYQGQFGLIDNYGEFNQVDYNDHIKYFEDFATYVNEQRANIVNEAQHLNAIVDDILITTYLLLYKIKNLS